MGNKTTLKLVLRHIRRYIGLLILSILLAAVTVVFTLYLPILVGQAIDEVVGPGKVDFPAIFRIFRIARHRHRRHRPRPVAHEYL